MATYEGKWRCERCRTINRGRDLNCASCGVRRDEDTEFFLDGDAPAVEDGKLLTQAEAGADWICRYCGGSNQALDTVCSSCGNQRSEDDAQLQEETRGINDWTEAAQKLERSKKSKVAGTENQPEKVSPETRKRFRFLNRRTVFTGWLLSIGILILIAAAMLFLRLWTLEYPVEVEVVNLEWTRSVALEEFRTISESDWEGNLPPDARIVSQSRQLHHTNRVPTSSHTITETYTERQASGSERYVCGKTNKKNGFFEDKYCTRTIYKTVTKSRPKTVTDYTDVPVYETRYNYQVDRWTAAGSRDTGGSDFNPQWAVVAVDNVRTREAGRTENYNLICRELGGDNKLLKIDIGSRWSNFQTGMRLHGKVNYFGKLVSVEELPGSEW